MDTENSDLLNLGEQELTNFQVDPNVLNLGDTLEQCSLMPLNVDEHKVDVSNRDEDADEKTDELLSSCEPTALSIDDDKISEETVAISKFAEDFVEPILKEVIARHKSEIEEEGNDFHNENNVDKKSEKSSSDDGFEYVKGDDVAEAMHHEIIAKTNEGIEVKKELEDLAFQEEIRLESAEKEFTPEIVDKDECYYNNNKKEVTELLTEDVVDVLESEIEDVAETNDDLSKEEDDVMRCMDTLLENILPSEDTELEPTFVPHVEEILQKEINLQSATSSSAIDHDIKGKCKDIISWSHPVSSAIAFSILMFIELGLMMEYSIISLLAYSGLWLMAASFFYKIAVHFRLINTQSSMNCIMTFNKEDVEYCVDATLVWVDYVHKEIKSIAYMESLTKNVKVFIMLWILTYIGQMFNLQSLIFIGSILLFSMPVVYGKFKSEIDSVLSNVCSEICGNINKIKSKCQRLVGCR